MLSAIGSRVLAFTESAGKFSLFTGRALTALVRPPYEWRETMKQLERIGVASFPVVAVTCLFTGMVFTLQTYDGFARFQAESYVPGILGVALLRELAPVIGGLMMAGRVGSAMAAELGTMRVTRQIDAMEVMATDPLQYLVVPRMLATILMLPLLIAMGDLIGIWGGWYLISVVLDAPLPGFFDRVFDFLEPFDFWSGMIKSLFFGFVIATVGCYKGLTTRGGAEGVGTNTTNAVVYASLGILVSDFFLTRLLT